LKLAYSTNAFTHYTLFEAVDKIASLGFGGIEVMGDRPHLYPPDWDQDALVSLRDWISLKGLCITNINSFTLFAVGNMHLPSWIEGDRERREIRIQHTIDCLRLAAFLGCANISVPPGGPRRNKDRGPALSLFREGLERVIPATKKFGVKVLIEPEPELLLENSWESLEFIKDVHSPFIGINFDIGHFFCAGEDPSEAFMKLLPWIGHVHIEDIADSRSHYHLIAGHGAINFRKVLRTIRHSGYQGNISLELYTYSDKPEDAGRESLQHLLPLFQEAGFDLSAPPVEVRTGQDRGN
jgi:sugar phosphate isomerase/epimerase